MNYDEQKYKKIKLKTFSDNNVFVIALLVCFGELMIDDE